MGMMYLSELSCDVRKSNFKPQATILGIKKDDDEL